MKLMSFLCTSNMHYASYSLIELNITFIGQPASMPDSDSHMRRSHRVWQKLYQRPFVLSACL